MKNITAKLLIAIPLSISITACGGGDGDSPSNIPRAMFADAKSIDINSTESDIILKKSDVNYYNISDATQDNDYYIKVKNSSSITNQYVNKDIELSIYAGEGFIKKYDFRQDYTKVIEIQKTTSSDLNFKIEGASKNTQDSNKYNFEIFPSLANGLEQNTTTFEPNDFKNIAYKIQNNQNYDSRVKAIDDFTDWYLIHEDTKKGNDYYFEITANENNPTGITQRNLHLEYHDKNGKLEEKTAYTGISYSNQIIAQSDGKLYAKIYRYPFSTGNGAGDKETYRYNIKTYKGISEGLEQNSTTYEPNNFQKLAYTISLDSNISSRVYGYKTEALSSVLKAGHIDRADWYTLNNISLKEYNLTIASSSENRTGVTSRNLYIEIYDDQGILKKKETINTGNTATLTFTPTIVGKLYFKIYAQYTKYLYKYNFIVSEK